MHTIVCTQPHDMELRDVPDPQCAPGEAMLKIRRVGICGTDIHAYGGNQPYFTYPRVLGHELSGDIVGVGEDVDDALVGHSAYVIPYLHCGKCRACRQGQTNCCQHMQVIGVHRDGGMAEYLSVPVAHLVTSSTLDAEQLALVECLSIGAHAVRRSGTESDELVVVVGAGPIGIGIVQIAQSRGARVLVVDTNRERLAFCRDTLGADGVLHALDDDVEAAIERHNDGALADVVFDATGNPKAMNRGFDFAGHGGRYVLVSVVKADITFNDPDFHKRELSLLGSRNATREDFETVARLMEEGRLQSTAMITHRGHYADLPSLMPQWCDPATGVIKAMVTFDDATTQGGQPA
ncbi:zinc-binding alcohol dehydrogenase family protein [Chromohalobacter sp. HP20-39]|uniref:zinc-binding alcohol dehydrogenase family protein n=1 Tax=Chromohalobacter sp. HP20-39 TaxID=3079306 RepID=UPI00294AC690|nr:zinc-binding alcohol dehydrogenase family protein [Chromohalobacter sp. HP20-39]MDV6320043.1 zinc-binding alcohol dehydrogenase family protein [Chromohalobacter sp. HP20-39]